MSNFLFVLSSNDLENATRCFQLSRIAHSNMVLDGGPHLIDIAVEAKVFNF